MILITVLIIISFTFFYSRHDFDKGSVVAVATIYGRPVTYAQYQRAGRKFELSQQLQMEELVGSLGVRSGDDKDNFIYNGIVLQHEAEKLGIDFTADDATEAIQAMPVFQTNGAYDSNKFKFYNDMLLGPKGFTFDDLVDLVRDDLRLKKIKAVLGSTVASSESELRDTFAEATQKTEASVVRLKLDEFLATTQVSDDDLKKAYEERKGTLKTDELRKVKFVAFTLPVTEKPLEAKARAEALGALKKKAEEFSVAMTEKDAKFDEQAAKAGVKVEETKDFPRKDPPAELGNSPQAAATAFKLTPEQPNGDIVSTRQGYYVLQLVGVTPARPLTFEEAKNTLTDDLKRDRARETLTLKAGEIRNKIEAEMKAGKSFADAVTAANAKAEKFPPFSQEEPQIAAENSAEVTTIASDLKEGQLSPPTPTPDGSVIVYVEKRLPIDEEKYKAMKPRVADFLNRRETLVIFAEWLKLRRNASGLQIVTSTKG